MEEPSLSADLKALGTPKFSTPVTVADVRSTPKCSKKSWDVSYYREHENPMDPMGLTIYSILMCVYLYLSVYTYIYIYIYIYIDI